MTAPAGDMFEVVACEWIKAQVATWTPAHSARILSRFERDVFPAIGATAVAEVTAPQILAMLRPVDDRAPDVAGRGRMTTGAIMRYAVATGRASRDPAADFRGALKPTPRVKHMARIEAGELSSFLQKLARYDGVPQTRYAIELVMHTFVRTNELRFGRWSEIEGDVWRIPGSRMKMGRDHIVPLTDAGEDEYFRGEAVAAATEALRFDPPYSVRVISDLVPNPFVARGIIAELVAALEQRGLDPAKQGAGIRRHNRYAAPCIGQRT